MNVKCCICRWDMFVESRIFKEVYEEYFTALKYFAMRYVKDEEVACDLLQDVFIKLWEKGDRFEDEMQLKTYLYRVVEIIA